MALADIKIATEEYIKTNWTTTSIFYGKQEIKGEDAIHLSFIPIDRELYSAGCGAGRKLDYTMMKIRFYSTNALKLLQYQDEMIALLECYQVGNIHYDIAKPDGLGSLDLDNGMVEATINFNARTFN